jgi:hypothetical protein
VSRNACGVETPAARAKPNADDDSNGLSSRYKAR